MEATPISAKPPTAAAVAEVDSELRRSPAPGSFEEEPITSKSTHTPDRKRQPVEESGEGNGCKHCACKKSRCLKLTEGSSRDKGIKWPEHVSKWMLEWYISEKKKRGQGFKYKAVVHKACAAAINERFGLGVNSNQTSRHWRFYKENWAIINRYKNKNGSNWDAVDHVLTPSKDDLAAMSIHERKLMNKPVKLYNHLKELFAVSSGADGNHGYDPKAKTVINNTPTRVDNDDGSDDLANSPSLDTAKEDLEAFEFSSSQRTTPEDDSSTPGERRSKREATTKRAQRNRPVRDEGLTLLTSTIKELKDSLHANPLAPLFTMIHGMTLTQEQKHIVGAYLCVPERAMFASFLLAGGREFVESWVLRFLGRDIGGL